MKKSNLIILDANVVIDAHREGYWNALINGHKIHLPATVLRDEAQYFDTGNGAKKAIQLIPLVQKGIITEIEATIQDELHLQSLVKPAFWVAFDPGEREAIALLKSDRYREFFFCTGDAAAVKGLSILGLSNQGISVEKLLSKIGTRKNLKRHFTENWFQHQLSIGFQEKDLWLQPVSSVH